MKRIIVGNGVSKNDVNIDVLMKLVKEGISVSCINNTEFKLGMLTIQPTHIFIQDGLLINIKLDSLLDSKAIKVSRKWKFLEDMDLDMSTWEFLEDDEVRPLTGMCALEYFAGDECILIGFSGYDLETAKGRDLQKKMQSAINFSYCKSLTPTSYEIEQYRGGV